MNKKRLAIASLLTLAFTAAAVHLEWTGYGVFDRDDGENLLCQIDPECRHLTDGEKKLASQYFGDRVDYKNVKIFNRPFMRIFGHGHSGMAPNGNMYFADKEDRSPNFAHENYYHQAPFIHEMTHVAQKQSGMDIPRAALSEWFKHAFNYGATYHYEIDTTIAFEDMNLEQQAAMMEHYFIKRNEFAEATTFTSFGGTKYRNRYGNEAWVAAQCKEMALYEVKFHGHYPVGKDELCVFKPSAGDSKRKQDTGGQGFRPSLSW